MRVFCASPVTKMAVTPPLPSNQLLSITFMAPATWMPQDELRSTRPPEITWPRPVYRIWMPTIPWLVTVSRMRQAVVLFPMTMLVELLWMLLPSTKMENALLPERPNAKRSGARS